MQWPRDKSAGLSQEEADTIRENIIKSKLATIERINKKPNRIHLKLTKGDKVLLRLGNRKTVEEDHFTVVSVRGNEVFATNDQTGRLYRRHLSRFTKIGGKDQKNDSNPTPKPENENQDPDKREDDIAENNTGPIGLTWNGARPKQPLNRQPAENQDQRAAQNRRQNRRVQINNRAQRAEYDQDREISPPTTRRNAREQGIPVPNFNLPSAPLERNPQARDEVNQILNQYRQRIEEQRQLPPRQEPQNQNDKPLD